MAKEVFVVAGVSGHTGAATADELLARGSQVRVIVRDAAKGVAWKEKGASVAIADLTDVSALTQALQGATGAYLLLPPNFAAQDYLADRLSLTDGMKMAVTAARLQRLVFLSSVGAQHASGTGPIVTTHRAEKLLANVAPSVTFLRAAYFLSNWSSVVPLAKSQGILPHYGKVNSPLAQVGATDIGTMAADALLEGKPGRNVIELAGLADWSVDDIAAALAQILQRPIQAVSAPVTEAHAGLLKAGLPPEIARLYAEMYQGIESGLVDFENKSTIQRGATKLELAMRKIAQ
jgi:uncharacterized protein YbjT (DUF2867 family)